MYIEKGIIKMNRTIRNIIAIVLALLSVASIGAIAVSATGNYYDPETDPAFAVYFEDCKNWNQVWAYTWMEKDIKNAKGDVIATEITEVAPFPGIELSEVGKTTLIDKVEYPDVTEHDIFEYKCGEYRKGMENAEYDRAFVIFNQGFEHGQQSSAIHVGKFFCGIHLVELDKDNNATIAHAVSTEYICLFGRYKKA